MGTGTAYASPGVDFVIVTALEEERDAVLDKLPGYKRLPPSDDVVNVYYAADVLVTFPDNSIGNYKVVIMCLIKMGQTQAALAASEAIRKWQPRHIMLVGIAGGVAGRARLGDVLVPDQIVDYELQKVTPDRTSVRWVVSGADPALLAAIRAITGDAWQRLITVARPGEGAPQRKVGPIATGNKVLADGATLEEYRETWEKLIGVEMEAGGVASAAFHAAQHVGFCMVRGVSDLADPGKGSAAVEEWRAYACDVAAAYAIGLLHSGPVVPLGHRQMPKPKVAETAEQKIEPAPDEPAVPAVVHVPAGPFRLGSPPDDYEAPANTKPGREFYLPVYRIGRYPVTNDQFAIFVEATRYVTTAEKEGGWSVKESEFIRGIDWRHPLETGSTLTDKDDHPVVQVSYQDALAYCHWLSETTQQSWRLPTEAEWEKAARGHLPNKQRYVWGNDWRSHACNSAEAGKGSTTPVSAFEQINRSAFGVIDMAGNVWEWTGSWYAPYSNSKCETASYGQRYRVIRGGSYHNPGKDARISVRGRYKPDVRRPYLGFRVMLETSASPVVTLRQILVERFSLEELRDLCMDLQIDHESLPHNTKTALVRELVTYCQRRERVTELSAMVQRLRPDISW